MDGLTMRLIDADALKEAFYERGLGCKEIDEIIDEAPTDMKGVVPVTHCVECKHSCCISNSRYCTYYNEPFADCEVDDDFYCKHGARGRRGDVERFDT